MYLFFPFFEQGRSCKVDFQVMKKTNGNVRRDALYGILSVCIAGWALPASATEGGGQEFPIGVDTVDPALVPAPGGNILLSYTVGYIADRVNDQNGHSAHPGFHVDVAVEAIKLVHTWSNQAGIDISSGIVNGVNNTDLTVIPGAVKGQETGAIDTELLPIILHTEVGHGLHLQWNASVWMPDGTYDRNNPASMGFNKTSFGMQFMSTWLPTPKWDLSTATTVEFGAKNSATQYYSGSSVNTDFQVGYRPIPSLPKLQVGVQGFYFQQVEDDKQYGVIYENGYQGRAVGVGPQIRYDAFEHGGIILKYQREVLAENRPQGDKLWLQMGIPF
jgi:hypothetical protein